MNNTINILIVEDNQTFIDVLGMFLSEYKGSLLVTWETCTSLAAAIQRLEEPGIDVCLFDLNLPNGKGIETLLRLYDAYPEVPVVVLTADVSEELKKICLSLGRADDFMGKFELGTSVKVGEFVWRLCNAARSFDKRSEVARQYRDLKAKITSEKELCLKPDDSSISVESDVKARNPKKDWRRVI